MTDATLTIHLDGPETPTIDRFGLLTIDCGGLHLSLACPDGEPMIAERARPHGVDVAIFGGRYEAPYTSYFTNFREAAFGFHLNDVGEVINLCRRFRWVDRSGSPSAVAAYRSDQGFGPDLLNQLVQEAAPQPSSSAPPAQAGGEARDAGEPLAIDHPGDDGAPAQDQPGSGPGPLA